MSTYIRNLIKEGENQQLDFKFEISDSKKIAKTLVAFANTNGGKLLVGVKDNGKIAGVRYDEEYYMVEAAAQLYCKPEIKFSSREWQLNGKIVLEIIVPKSENKPHYAYDHDGRWLAYIRVDDQNLLANDVMIKVWKNSRKSRGVKIHYTDNEKLLLDFLEQNKRITLSKFCKIAKITRFDAKKILINLISIQIIDIVFTEKQIYYEILPDGKLDEKLKKSG